MSILSVPNSVPTAIEDAEQLRKAFAGWGTNEGLIISILAHRSSAQRLEIRKAYADTYGEDLLKALNKELTHDFEKIVFLWVLDPAERDAVLAYDSARRWGPGDRTLIEIACTRRSEELFAVRRVYHARYKRAIEEDVAFHAKGDFRKETCKGFMKCYVEFGDGSCQSSPIQSLHLSRGISSKVNHILDVGLMMGRSDVVKYLIPQKILKHENYHHFKLLVLLLTAYRYEGPEVNQTLAKSEAKLLHEKIEDKSYADDEIIRVLTTRSKAQLAATFNAYHNAFGHPINKDLKANPKDHYLSALRAITKCITYPENYFEKAIRLAINKTGTDEDALTRVVATRAEIDLKLVKDLYQKRNSVPLVRAIKKDTSGDYEDFLVALIGE